MATLILDYFGQETGLKLGNRAIIYDLVSDDGHILNFFYYSVISLWNIIGLIVETLRLLSCKLNVLAVFNLFNGFEYYDVLKRCTNHNIFIAVF